MPPTTRQLEALVLVHRLGSVTQAAKRMNLTQSTVSVLLRQLEHNVGARLFDRTTRVLSPTEAASQVLPFAERALREIEQMQRTVHQLLTKESGRVRLAASAALSASALPEVIASFAGRYPNVELELHDVAPSTLNHMVQNNEVDFAVGGWPENPSSDLRYEPVRSGRLVAVRRRSDPPPPPTITWAELSLEPAVLGITAANAIRKRIDRELGPMSLSFDPTLECELLSTIIALALEGLGVAVVPEDLIGRQYETLLDKQRLVSPEVPHDIVLITRPEVSQPPAAEAFIAELRQRLAGS